MRPPRGNVASAGCVPVGFALGVTVRVGLGDVVGGLGGLLVAGAESAAPTVGGPSGSSPIPQAVHASRISSGVAVCRVIITFVTPHGSSSRAAYDGSASH